MMAHMNLLQYQQLVIHNQRQVSSRDVSLSDIIYT